jgi:hypothetical protein
VGTKTEYKTFLLLKEEKAITLVEAVAADTGFQMARTVQTNELKMGISKIPWLGTNSYAGHHNPCTCKHKSWSKILNWSSSSSNA